MPTRKEIKDQIIEKLSNFLERNKIKEDEKLFEDLGMGPIIRKAMAIPYTKISRKYDKGLTVSMEEAGKLKTVKETIDLVFKKSKGERK